MYVKSSPQITPYMKEIYIIQAIQRRVTAYCAQLDSPAA
jgi:hypothetical protein